MYEFIIYYLFNKQYTTHNPIKSYLLQNYIKKNTPKLISLIENINIISYVIRITINSLFRLYSN